MRSGVRSTDAFAVVTAKANIAGRERSVTSERSKASAISRTTVRMVPSTGLPTALYAWEVASRKASGKSSPLNLSLPATP